MRRLNLRRDDGVAMTEFALILPIFMLVVAGVLAFGRAFFYWIDANHLANETARYRAKMQRWAEAFALMGDLDRRQAAKDWPAALKDCDRILALIERAGFHLWHPQLDAREPDDALRHCGRVYDVATGRWRRSWGWETVRAFGPSHMSIDPGSSGSNMRGRQAASSSIRRTPKEYS